MTDEIILPFGVHKGEFVHKQSSGYLKWLAENCDWNTDIQEAADEEYQFREKNNCHEWD